MQKFRGRRAVPIHFRIIRLNRESGLKDVDVVLLNASWYIMQIYHFGFPDEALRSMYFWSPSRR